MLFHEIYGVYYKTTASILREAVKGTLTDAELNRLVMEQAFGESMTIIPRALKNGDWMLLHPDLSTPLQKVPDMPMTTLEKRWLKTLLSDPRICLFFPDGKGLEDVEPLFTQDRIVYYDMYTNGDPYRDPVYISHFRVILRALRESHNLHIIYETKHGERKDMVVTPYCLEYSEKNDRFRLIGANMKKAWTINVKSIVLCELARSKIHSPFQQPELDTVTFELTDEKNALERVLLHFSHLRKETRHLDQNRYRVTLWYERDEITDMVIRILSFGSVIRVTEPQAFKDLVRERIRRQLLMTPHPFRQPVQG